MMVDLDHFKAINDTFGHQVGDEALVTVARAMREAVRTEDVVARYGGEEFVLAGLCRNESEPLDLAARLVEVIRHLQVELPDRTLRLTASLGLTLVQPGHLSPPWITLKVADRALYRAKAAGRDRYVVEPGVLGTGGKGVAALCVSEGHMTTEGMR